MKCSGNEKQGQKPATRGGNKTPNKSRIKFQAKSRKEKSEMGLHGIIGWTLRAQGSDPEESTEANAAKGSRKKRKAAPRTRADKGQRQRKAANAAEETDNHQRQRKAAKGGKGQQQSAKAASSSRRQRRSKAAKGGGERQRKAAKTVK